MKKIQHPDWVTRFKRPNTELKKIKNRYYLYEVSAKWDKIKKKSIKISGKILGSTTQEHGFKPSKIRLAEKNISSSISGDIRIAVKDYGSIFLIESLANDTKVNKNYISDDLLAGTQILFKPKLSWPSLKFLGRKMG